MKKIYNKPMITIQNYYNDILTTSVGLDKDETERIEISFLD